MKIELNDWQDVRDLVAMMNPSLLREWNPHLGKSTLSENIEREMACDMRVRHDEVVGHVPTRYDEPEGLPTDIAQPEGYVEPDDVRELREALDAKEKPERDADGVPHNTDWHSDPPKINADGRWRARRKRDEGAYKAWLLEQAVEVAEAAVAADAEPVATETHALPQDDAETAGDAPEVQAAPETAGDAPEVQAAPETAGDAPEVQAAPETAGGAAPTVDLTALVEKCRPLAASQSADVRELLSAAQAFTTAYGHARFNELKSAVTPVDGNPFGKALQLFSPEERQLMQACIKNYPKP